MGFRNQNEELRDSTALTFRCQSDETQVHITNSPNRMKASGTHRQKEEIFFREVQTVLKLRGRLTRKRPVRLSFIPFSLNIKRVERESFSIVCVCSRNVEGNA